MTPLETVLEVADGARKSGTGWSAKCPAHEDGRASLSITEGADGKVLLFCHAGCDFASIVKAYGLEDGDLFPPKDREGRRIVAEYAYTDENGAELFQAVRFEPKDFRQRHREAGAWQWNLNGTRRVLYRLPELLEGVKVGATVYVVEGEKDVEALRSLGLTATCNPMGAGKWRDEYSGALRGARVVIIADKDEPGRKHAKAVEASLRGKAASVRIVEVPDGKGKDAADWIAAGATREDFEKLAAPAEAPDAPLSVVDLLRRVYVGARFSTGLADLNDLLKGGLAPGFLFVIGGEPWIGKTTLLVQIGDSLAAEGVAVFMWATDEPPEGLALRLGQLHGEEQSELNSEHPAVLETLTEALANGPRFLPESAQTVSEAVAFAERYTPAGKVAALLLDSLQSQAERNLEEGQSPRAALSSLMAELNAAKKRGLIIGAASELSRGGYASQDPGQRTRGLASFAESRAIEYRSDVAMTMVKASGGGEDLVRVEVLKNRLGHRKGGMTLRLNHARARLQPVDEEAVKRRDAEETRLVEQEKLHAEEDRILEVLAGLPAEKADRGLSADEIRDRARMKKKAVLEALARLCDAERVNGLRLPREAGQAGRVPYRFRLAREEKKTGAA